jgi:hypothetical protein
MLQVFKTAKELCEGTAFSGKDELVTYITTQNKKQWISAEQTLGMGALLSQISSNKLTDPGDSTLMKDLFHIIPSTQLGMFRVVYNSHPKGPKEFWDDSYFDNTTDVKNINDYGI